MANKYTHIAFKPTHRKFLSANAQNSGSQNVDGVNVTTNETFEPDSLFDEYGTESIYTDHYLPEKGAFYAEINSLASSNPPFTTTFGGGTDSNGVPFDEFLFTKNNLFNYNLTQNAPILHNFSINSGAVTEYFGNWSAVRSPTYIKLEGVVYNNQIVSSDASIQYILNDLYPLINDNFGSSNLNEIPSSAWINDPNNINNSTSPILIFGLNGNIGLFENSLNPLNLNLTLAYTNFEFSVGDRLRFSLYTPSSDGVTPNEFVGSVLSPPLLLYSYGGTINYLQIAANSTAPADQKWEVESGDFYYFDGGIVTIENDGPAPEQSTATPYFIDSMLHFEMHWACYPTNKGDLLNLGQNLTTTHIATGNTALGTEFVEEVSTSTPINVGSKLTYRKFWTSDGDGVSDTIAVTNAGDYNNNIGWGADAPVGLTSNVAINGFQNVQNVDLLANYPFTIAMGNFPNQPIYLQGAFPLTANQANKNIVIRGIYEII
jgi:hypothetical protein